MSRTTTPSTDASARPRSASVDIVTIADAFTRTAAKYDAFALDHPHLTRMREKVYAAVERSVPPDSRVLELNAGTGTDAVQLVRRGYTVHATDVAPGMLARVHAKAAAADVGARLSVQACSFLELERVEGAPYDAVFSNLGGLNCAPDLGRVARGIDRVLAPGGVAVVILMPPICLWELGLVFTGQFRLAVRRLTPGGTRARLEGRHFTVYYYAPHQVASAFGPSYELLSVEGLSVLTPTAESKNLAKRHPRTYRTLARLDDRVATHAPFSRWGDFFIATLRRSAL